MTPPGLVKAEPRTHADDSAFAKVHPSALLFISSLAAHEEIQSLEQ
jgi:hypothetical protein